MGNLVYYGTFAAAALLPAVVLMIFVYRQDKVEKEPAGLLALLFAGGLVAAGLSYFIESVVLKGSDLVYVMTGSQLLYAVSMAVLVGLTEEITKYVMLKKISWNHSAFDYRFDGVVYAVFVSLGFAGIENILYVMNSGMQAALLRAVTSIPGHTVFAVIMGIYYGRAKVWAARGYEDRAKSFRQKAVINAAMFHALFDAMLLIGSILSLLLFLVVLLNVYRILLKTLREEAAMDESIVPAEPDVMI